MTDILVPQLGVRDGIVKSDPGLVLGTAQLVQPYGVLARPFDLSRRNPVDLIHLAEAQNFVALDTSPVYGGAEHAIGMSDSGLEVHTKCHPNLSVEESLKKSRVSLRRKYLDIVYLHQSLHIGGDAVSKLHNLGDHIGVGVGAVGASVYEVDEFLLALEIPEVSVIQVPLSIMDRRFAGSGLLGQAVARGKRVFARSVFLQGLLVTKPSRLPSAFATLMPYLTSLEQVALLSGTSPVGLALSYVKQFSNLSGIIVGASSPTELQGVVSEYSRSVNREVLDLVEAIEPPAWELVDPRRWPPL